MVRKHDDLEYKVLQIIKSAGKKGILQSQLWKKINATSREGSRISSRLERSSLIDRNRELHEGKWTYRLVTKKSAMTIDSIIVLPCTFCSEQEKCGPGSDISPITCERLTKWISLNTSKSD
jgi:DNA-binding MarR family transcriptional regulator